MRCRKCGAEIPEDKIYCEKCGTAIQMVPDYDPVVEAVIGTEEREEADRESASAKHFFQWAKRLFFLAVLVLIGFLGFQSAYRSAAPPDEMEAEAAMTEDAAAEEAVLFLAAPKFSVAPGVYEHEQSLIISHPEQADGRIYYTTDGSSPGTGSQVYSSPINIGEGETLVRAIFVRSDGVMSEETESAYEVVFDYPKEPAFSVEPGEYETGFQVMLTSEPGCRIYYTTNGEEPGYDSTLYQGPISVFPGLTVLQAVAVDEDGGMSGIVEAIYKVAEQAAEEPEASGDPGAEEIVGE